MSYMTEILLQVRIPKRNLAAVQRDLADPEGYASAGLQLFLSVAAVSSANTIEFRANGHDLDSEYCEDQEDLVLALKAPWRDFDDIAAWLAPHATRGSRLLVHSLEADGNDFGYEFDGRDRCRRLRLSPSGGWLRPIPVPTVAEVAQRGLSQAPKRTNWARWPARQGANAVTRAWRIIGEANDALHGRLSDD